MRRWIELILMVALVAVGSLAYRRAHPPPPPPPKQDQLFEEGLERYRAGHYDQALTCFEEMLKIFPDSPRALTYEGMCLAGLGRPEQAWKAYDHAARVTDSMTGFLAHSALRLHIERTRLALMQKNYAKAQRELPFLILRSGTERTLPNDSLALEGYEMTVMAEAGALTTPINPFFYEEDSFQQLATWGSRNQKKRAYQHWAALLHANGNSQEALKRYRTGLKLSGCADHPEPCPLCEHYKTVDWAALKP